ncbi:hypothetical protein P167DRAFT_278274 [Morchella conica CCBAS932]|uniref:Uncharacterized protein n=1 Tax=Morchella conica CCBAS932 TaxID=1392247 RepID=A0A3N4KWN6_9PEZI|nr:hypothetical protein P167DRAFT_278274 [Morchella conica CCBAS932]
MLTLFHSFFIFLFSIVFFFFQCKRGRQWREGMEDPSKGEEMKTIFHLPFFSLFFFSLEGWDTVIKRGGEAFLYYNYVHETETCSLEVTYKCMYSINLYICSLFLVWFGGGGIFQYLSQIFFFF